LTAFQPGQLFGLPVKLLNLPTQGAHLLYGRQGMLSKIVGHDIVRALGRQHHSEQFHLMLLGKAFDLDHFAVLFFRFRPCQSIHPLIGLRSTRIIHLAVVLKWAVIHLLQSLDIQQDVFGRIRYPSRRSKTTPAWHKAHFPTYRGHDPVWFCHLPQDHKCDSQ